MFETRDGCEQKKVAVCAGSWCNRNCEPAQFFSLLGTTLQGLCPLEVGSEGIQMPSEPTFASLCSNGVTEVDWRGI